MSVYWDKKLVESMVFDIVNHLDYDLAKSLDPDLAEEPEFAEATMEDVCDIVWAYIDAGKRESVA